MNFKTVSLIACSLLVFCYLAQQYYYASAFPFGDDLPTIFNLLLDVNNAESFSEKARIIYNNHFLEHRLLPSSIVTLIIYWISGSVPLRLFTLAAGFIWIGLLLYYYKYLKKTSSSIEWFLPITCVLLSPAAYEATYWPMAALQHFLVLFFVTVTINFLCAEQWLIRKYFALAVLCGFLTSFSSGNGLAVWPVGLLILLMRQEYILTI